MNTYNGLFSKTEIDLLDSVVEYWTFWNVDGVYYARDDACPDGRITCQNFNELYYTMQTIHYKQLYLTVHA